MLGKIENGQLITARPKYVVIDNKKYKNPTDERLIQAGWKEVTYLPVPEIPEGAQTKTVYTETADAINVETVIVEGVCDNKTIRLYALEQRLAELTPQAVAVNAKCFNGGSSTTALTKNIKDLSEAEKSILVEVEELYRQIAEIKAEIEAEAAG